MPRRTPRPPTIAHMFAKAGWPPTAERMGPLLARFWTVTVPSFRLADRPAFRCPQCQHMRLTISGLLHRWRLYLYCDACELEIRAGVAYWLHLPAARWVRQHVQAFLNAEAQRR